MKYSTITVNMPEDLKKWLGTLSETKDVTPSEIITHTLSCLKRHIEQPIENAENGKSN